MVVIHRGRGHHDVAEPVGAIQVDYGTAVAVPQLLRIAAIAEVQETRFPGAEALADGLGGEESVADELDVNQLVPGVACDGVVDYLHAGGLGFLGEIGRCLEIALGLEVIDQVARALEQQAAVHGPLFIDGDQLAQASARD